MLYKDKYWNDFSNVNFGARHSACSLSVSFSDVQLKAHRLSWLHDDATPATMIHNYYVLVVLLQSIIIIHQVYHI